MRAILKVVFLLILPYFSLAQLDLSAFQKLKLDSLKSALQQTSNDTLRMRLYSDIEFYFAEVNLDSSLFYAESELAIAQKINQQFWEADAYGSIAYMKLKMGNYPEAFKAFIHSIKLLENPLIEKNIWGLLKNQTPRSARLDLLAVVRQSLGLLYRDTGNTDKQLSILLEIKKYSEAVKNQEFLTVVNMNLGQLYMEKMRLDSALVFELAALNYADNSDFTLYKGYILTLIGSIYLKEKDIESAKNYITKAIVISQEVNNKYDLGEAYIVLSDLYRLTGQADSSLLYAKKGLLNLKALSSVKGTLKAYTAISYAYKQKMEIDSAYRYLQLATTLRDSLHKSEKDRLVQFLNADFNEQLKLEELKKEQIRVQNNMIMYVLLAGLGTIILIVLILYRSYRQKRRANILLNKQNEQIRKTLAELKTTQTQLIQKEKLAGLGELTAGIAHEIQNPLNFVNNFAEVSIELSEELEQSVDENNKPLTKALSTDLRLNMLEIARNGQRASNIVRAMLEHSQASTGERRPTDLNNLADEYLKLAYHGFRAKDSHFIVKLETDFYADLPHPEVVVQDISRVLLNLYNNALYAVYQRQSQENRRQNTYEPTIRVSTHLVEGQVELRVGDNGMGIPANIVDKVFQPFFTTKPTGEGTGLGLSLSYDIITKGHNGTLEIQSQPNQFTEFIITLPPASL